MPRALADTFATTAEAIRKRKKTEAHDTGCIKACIKVLGSAISESEPTDDDQRILRAAPDAFRDQYPSAEPWSGEHLTMLLSEMRNLLHEIVSGRPVHIAKLDDAMQFCTMMRFGLLNGAP